MRCHNLSVKLIIENYKALYSMEFIPKIYSPKRRHTYFAEIMLQQLRSCHPFLWIMLETIL